MQGLKYADQQHQKMYYSQEECGGPFSGTWYMEYGSLGKSV